MTASLYKTDGTVEEVSPADGKSFTLDELYAFVGSPIDITNLPSGKQIVLNDEGALAPLEANEKAFTEIWEKEFPIEEYPHNNVPMLFGNVLLSDPNLLN